jgi:hypothetical protein
LFRSECAEPGFELVPAIQQASAPPTDPRCTLFFLFIQGWKEQLDKAREHYNELKLGASNSLEHFLGYEDEEDDDLSAMRPRRRVSRRGSHLSSLAHSHSGSIELQESARRDPSFELRWVGLKVRTTTMALLVTSLKFSKIGNFVK